MPYDSNLVIKGPCSTLYWNIHGTWARCARSESSLDLRDTHTRTLPLDLWYYSEG